MPPLLHAALFRSLLLPCFLLVVAGCGPDIASPPPPREPVTLLSCYRDHERRPLLASVPGAHCGTPGTIAGPTQLALVGFQLVGIPWAGPTVVKHEFFQIEQKELSVVRAAVASRGEYVAAALAARPSDPALDGPVSIEMVVLDRVGGLLHQRRIEVPYENWGQTLTLFGDDRGVFVLGYRFGDVVATEVVSGNGLERGPFDGFLPITNPDEAGYIAIQDERDLPNRPVSWLDPCSGERTPAARNELSTGGATELRTELVYHDVLANDLVLESSSGLLRTHLGDASAVTIDAHPDGYVLFGTKDPKKLITVHARTGQTKTMTITIPSGLRRYDALAGPGFDGAADEVHVTSFGHVTLPLRDDAKGRLYVTENGESWTPLGAPIGEVHRAFSAESSNTFLHFGSDFAVSLPPWDPPPVGEARLDGMSLQLVRQTAGISIPIAASNTRYYHLTRDGGCVSFATGGSLVRASAATGEVTTIALTPDENWSLDSTFTWASTQDDITFLAQ